MFVRRRLTLFAMTVAAAPLAVGACTAGPRSAVKQAEAAPPSVTVTPADRARDVPISAEVGTKVSNGRVTGVKLTDDKGRPVPAQAREDGSGWVPDAPLANSRTYTAEVTVSGDSGKTATRKTTFTTMARSTKPAVTSELYFQDKQTYGTAMPVVLGFDPPIPPEARADVQRRLFVRTSPSQPGTWSWMSDGKQAEYRAPDRWKPGTTISVRSALEGLPIGKEAVGDSDRVATAKVGRQVSLDIDNTTKQMTVYQDGKVLRKLPVSLGKPSTPSSSGTMVIMEKHEHTTFDTRGEPDGGYVVDVDDAQRLTWGGEFIHSAPWSEGEQGYNNTSHGCTNVSAAGADWLMGVTQVGDLVTVKGTEVQLQPGNGFTAWNVGWNEFAKGSALPVPAGLKPTQSPTPHPGAVAGGSAPAPTPTRSNSGG
ncbi:L,D-transpeptidase [Micromonospora robiginosa]|uniref:Ig-like domain-containing protein n=1 Tax=Micromonospora robiginosa TaxID=2749844 RepID=A0A7L6B3F4_9ACTN|nr:Ig-like domain-containing protein [Micromonospora ferruginea]QLQ36150.1 Ig-like domain-containing protein [Micromonospora ferruginea]